MIGIGLDSEVMAYAAALRTAGLEADSYELVALSRFVKRCRDAGLWNKLLEVLPFCGTTHAAAAYKLKIGGTPINGVVSPRLCTFSAPLSSANYQQRKGICGFNNIRGNTGFYTSYYFVDASDAMLMLSFDFDAGFNIGDTDYLCGNGIDTNNFSLELDPTLFKSRMNTNVSTGSSESLQRGLYHANRPASTTVYNYRNGVTIGNVTSAALGLSFTNDVRFLGRHSGQETDAWQHFMAYGQGFTNDESATLAGFVLLLLDELRRPVYA